jgi:hypothetical protein
MKGIAKANEPTNSGQLGLRPTSAATLGGVCLVQGGAPITRRIITRKRPLCIESTTCTGGLWRINGMEENRAEAEYLMRRFQEYGDPEGDGSLRRLTLYEQGRHARLLTRLSEDWQRERLGDLKQRGIFSSDPHARLPYLCSDHLRHALRVDVILDRAIRTMNLDPPAIQARDLLGVAEITASACWVPEATTLFLLALSRRWIPWEKRDHVVLAIQKLPPELRWPTCSSLFRLRKVTGPEALAQAVRRFGIAAAVHSDRDLQIAQRKIGIRLRALRKNPSRRKVKGAFQRLLA